MAEHKSPRFGLGLLIGTIVGALAGVFLSPKSGKENREEVAKKLQELKTRMDDAEVEKKAREIFGNVSQESLNLYRDTRVELAKRISQLKDAVSHIDKEKYQVMVNDVIEEVKKDAKISVEKMDALKKDLLRQWEAKPVEKKPAKSTKLN